MVIGLLLAASWPWTIGKVPGAKSSIEAKLQFLQTGGVLVFATLACLVTASIGAVILARAAREEYREELNENLKDLVTETQEAIKRKNEPAG